MPNPAHAYASYNHITLTGVAAVVILFPSVTKSEDNNIHFASPTFF